MRFILTPRDTHFYDLFEEDTANLLEAAQAALRETGPGDHALRRAPGLGLEAQVLEMTEVSR